MNSSLNKANFTGSKGPYFFLLPLILGITPSFSKFWSLPCIKSSTVLNCNLLFGATTVQFNPLWRKFASEKALEKLHGKPWPVNSFWVTKAIFGTMFHVAQKITNIGFKGSLTLKALKFFYPLKILRTTYFKLFGMRGRIY